MNIFRPQKPNLLVSFSHYSYTSFPREMGQCAGMSSFAHWANLLKCSPAAKATAVKAQTATARPASQQPPGGHRICFQHFTSDICFLFFFVRVQTCRGAQSSSIQHIVPSKQMFVSLCPLIEKVSCPELLLFKQENDSHWQDFFASNILLQYSTKINFNILTCKEKVQIIQLPYLLRNQLQFPKPPVVLCETRNWRYNY